MKINKQHFFAIAAIVLVAAAVGIIVLSGQFPLLNCSQLYNEIEAEFDAANYCQMDSDCKAITLGGDLIEFGCFKFVNKEADEQALKARAEEYNKLCDEMINDCMPAPQAKCVSGKCVYAEKQIKYCEDYEIPMTYEQVVNCTCPEGKEKGVGLAGAYCATNSQLPCARKEDCPAGESCISFDGNSWFCTGLLVGNCYHHDPENPWYKICAD